MQTVRKEGNQFCQDLIVPCYQTDASFYLKPAAFMDMAQEIAFWAAQLLGFGYDDLQVHHTAWVLSRFHIRFTDPPRWRDPVTLRTWHKGLNGLFFLRDFRLLDATGKERITATSSWVVIDTETRRLVRPDHLQEVLAAGGSEESAIAEPAPKTVFPEGPAEAVGEHVVTYADVDILGHTNNARYMVWAMDALPYELTAARRVQEFFLQFNKETRPGTAVALFRCREGEDTWYIDGRQEGKSVFTVKIVFG